LIVDSSISSANIILLNPAALTSGTFIIDAAANETSLADDGSSSVKTFTGALQWGGTIGLDQKSMKFTGNMLLSADLTFHTGPSNGILELAGNIGDGGNGFGIHMEPENTRIGRLILSGANTFTGGLMAVGGATSGTAIVQLDGSLARGDITLGVRGRLEGTGTIFFRDGDSIDVAGTLDASALTFDLTGHSGGLYTIVDYSAGTFLGPGTIDDLLSSQSLLQGWSLTNTGTQITAFLEVPPTPEPSTLALLGLGAVFCLARRKQKSPAVG
jgi:hypothetical protein